MASSSPTTHTSLPKDTILNARRVTLRPLQASDLAAYHALRGNAQVMKYSATHRPDASPEATWQKMERLVAGDGAYEVKPEGSYMLAICLNDGLQTGVNAYNTAYAIEPGSLVGDTGVIKFESAADGAVEGEVGYMLDPRLWGRGLMSEALQAFVEHWRGFCQSRSLHVRLIANVEPENVGSLKVLGKCGFGERRRYVHEDGDLLAEMALDI